MGGVALKDKAAAYLLSAGKNKASEEVSALKVEMQSLKEAMEKKDERINDLLSQFTDGPPKKTRKKAA